MSNDNPFIRIYIDKLISDNPNLVDQSLDKIVKEERSTILNTFGPLFGMMVFKWLEELRDLKAKLARGELILPKFVPNTKHSKSNGLYCILATEGVRLEKDWEEGVLYLSKDGTLIIRSKKEFMDGRFEENNENKN